MNMKRFNTLLFSFILIITLAGCNNINADSEENSTEESVTDNIDDVVVSVSDNTPISDDTEENALDKAIRGAILAENFGDYLRGECQGIGYKIIETFEDDGVLSVYALTEYVEYGFQDGVLVNVSGTNPNVLMRFQQTESGDYELIFYTRLDLFSDLSEEEIEQLLKPLSETGKSYIYTDEDLQKVRAQADEDAAAYLKSINRDADVGFRTEHKGNLLTDLVSDTDLLMELSKDETYSLYPEWTGTQERIENGVRYIYQTEYDDELQQIIFSKILFDTNETVERQIIDIQG